MDMEAQVAQAMADELMRQADADRDALRVEKSGEGALTVEGRIDLDALAMAVVGAVAGGP